MLTAIVHFLNNVFKISMLFKEVDRTILLYFGIPAIGGAYLGSWLATHLDNSTAYGVSFWGEYVEVSYFTVVVAVLMILFALQEIFLGRKGLAFQRTAFIPGGVVSGFFGGLTGHQGALRSMFLLKSGLSTSAYVATGVAIAMLIDLTRLPRYLMETELHVIRSEWPVLLSATIFAFTGAFVGKRLMKNVTFRLVQWIVGLLMIVISLSLLTGAIS